MDQYIGKLLDNRYEILERIGTGGMAVVYKAKCHRLNRLVAIKILKEDFLQDADFRRRFNAESQAVAQLSHPNIMSVYDVSRGGDIEYIVMELIDGITLKQYMEKRGQLNWRESLHFITQIMRGLSHAHSRGIIHRDIKPQNMMVLRDGSVKVTDFGIACLANAAQTLTQEALGSVHYISPEQARGDRTDVRSDLYSAGVVLYEMLTGRLPFEGDSAVSVAIQHLSSIPLAPREINRDIPEQMELICMKAMAPDLTRRYTSADAMISDLEAFRKNPGMSLDFELSDLQREKTDEPTQPLRMPTPSRDSRNTTSPKKGVQRRVRGFEEHHGAATEKDRKTLVLIGAAGVLAAVLAIVLLKSIFNSFNTPTVSQYVVKDVVGLTLEEAQELEGVKDVFRIEIMEEPIFSEEYAPGEIVRQKPEEGEFRKGENTVIQVWISAGEDIAKMPDVLDVAENLAMVQLKKLKEKYDLTVEVREEDRQFHAEIAAGNIISTVPAAGESLKRGDTIQLIVSKGPQTYPLPPFTNFQLEAALQQLDALGFVKGEIEYVFSDLPEGMVVSQDPVANSQVPDGTVVNFKVSRGEYNGSGTFYPGTDTVIFALPSGQENGTLKVYQDGTLIFNNVIDCTPGNYALEVTASGETEIKAYLDGELIYDKIITIEEYYE